MKARLMSVRNTTWAFYEAMENGSKESMADYFETLMHHYKQRGILQKELNKDLVIGKIQEELMFYLKSIEMN